jgi:two-component system chemotaxis response regulator CheB
LKHSEPKALILIGASTGGPGQIQQIVQALPKDFAATIVIAQHIGDEYIPSFVNQLQRRSALKVLAVEDKLAVLSAHIYVCSHITQLVVNTNQLEFTQTKQENARYNPDIDHLFVSAAQLTVSYTVAGIILTGVGDDGARGCKALSDSGALCIAESEASAVVYGMPLQAKLQSKNISVSSLDEIIQNIRTIGD